MEKIHSVTLRLAGHTDRDELLRALVTSLIADFAFEYAAAISQTFQHAAGNLPETATDFGLLTRAVAEARATGEIDITVPQDSIQTSGINSSRLGWLLATPVSAGPQEFVLVVGRIPRTAAIHPPPWDRDIDRFRHLRDTVTHVLAAVDARAALIAERNNLKAEVERLRFPVITPLSVSSPPSQ